MTKDRFRCISLVVLAVAGGWLAGCSSSQPAVPKNTDSAPVNSEPQKPVFSHAEYGTLLNKYVEKGRVKYGEWVASTEDRAALSAYVKRLGEASPDAFPQAEQKAFWINAYNAITVVAVLEKYPLKSVNFDALQDKKAKGFWDTPYTVGGAPYSLNQIENTILRPRFHDPRIHCAINCASLGCPDLQPRAFEGQDLDPFLDTVTRQFLNDASKGAKWDQGVGKLTVSSIFQWYKDDFGDVPAFIARFRPEITGVKGEVAHFLYDWSLNEAPVTSVSGKRG